MADSSLLSWLLAITCPATVAAGAMCESDVPCDVLWPGDFDGDGDVDTEDGLLLGGCASRSDVPVGPLCGFADLDGDGDSDPNDFGLWQRLFTGPCDCPPLIQEPPNGQPGNPLRTTYLFSGEFYESAVDLRIKGRGLDFVWARKYRSRIGPNTPMGNRWDFAYNIHIQPAGPHIRVFDGNTRADVYRLQSDGTWTRPESFQILSAGRDGRYTLLFPDTGKWIFKPLDGSPAAGRIDRIEDRNGNALTFDYDSQGRLFRIHDALDTSSHNRDILITYNSTGFISRVTDFTGRQVRYSYYQPAEAGGSPGDLKSVTSPEVVGTPTGNDFPTGKTTLYTYSTGETDDRLNHLLLTITDPKGQTYLTNEYAPTHNESDLEFLRVLAQRLGDVGDRLDVTYFAQTPTSANGEAVIKAIVNDRVGNVSEHFYNSLNRCVMVREYTGRADPDLPTTDSTNRPQNPLRAGDPPYYETGYRFNGDAMITRVTHAAGNESHFIYDETNPDARSRGNLLSHCRLPDPLGGDQPQICQTFEYDPLINNDTNFVTRWVDGRGNTTTYTYDAAGNRTSIHHPVPATVEDFEYNSFGQTTAHIHPDDGSGHRRRDEFTYHTAGPQMGYLHQAVVDTGTANPLNLTTSYEYDAVGNVVRTVDPRGSDTLFTYNALDQLVRTLTRPVQLPAGPTRYESLLYYDVNDNLVRQCRQNVNDQGMIDPANAYITRITEYDILDFPTRTCSESGSFNVPGSPPQLDCGGLPASEFMTTEYDYDDNRNLAEVRFGEAVEGRQPDNVVHILYDERDLPFQKVRAPGAPDQSTAQTDYDANGNMTIVFTGLEDAANPHLTTYAYDGYDRLVSRTDAMGNVMTYHYDANGNVTSARTDGELADQTGGVGNVRLAETTYVYDAMDWLLRVEEAFFDPATQAPIDDGKNEARFFRSRSGHLLSFEDDNGHVTTFTYDTANRRRTTTDAKGNVVTYFYDANSNVVATITLELSDLNSPPETFTTSYAHDALDRLTQSTDNIGNAVRYAYDSRGNLTTGLDPVLNVTRFSYDSADRHVRTQRDLTDTGMGGGFVIGTATTLKAWDDSGRLTSQIDDNGNTTQYGYDALNRLTSITHADCTLETFIPEVNDEVLVAFDANGTMANYTYDRLNRRTAAQYTPGLNVAAGTTSENFAYDGLSRPVRIQDNDSLVTFAYDSLSNVRSHDQDGFITASTHDGLGNTLSCTYPGGRVVAYTYDALDRIAMMEDGAGNVMGTYDFIGPDRMQRMDYANGTSTTYLYDGQGNPSIPNPPGDFGVKKLIETHHFVPGGPTLDQRQYRWDRSYNKTQRADVRPASPQDLHLYSYDSLHRLQRGRKTKTFPAPFDDTDYVLDDVGNRLRVIENSVPGFYTADNTLCEPADFQMNQYTQTPFDARLYDRNGNLIGRAATPPASPNMQFDVHDQLVEHIDPGGVTTTFTYDALGRRLSKTVDDGSAPPQTTRYLWGANFSGQGNIWQVLEERDGAGTLQRSYAYGGGLDDILHMRVGSSDYFYHHDDMGNVMALTNAGGSVIERYEYGDFGQPQILTPLSQPLPASTVGNPYLFTGRRYDNETGLYYLRHRYLDPQAGRFISRDPIGIWGDPASAGNACTYAGNNPWTYTDQMGLAKEQFVRSKPHVNIGTIGRGTYHDAGANLMNSSVVKVKFPWLTAGAGQASGIEQFAAGGGGTHSWSYWCWVCEQCGGTGHDPNCDDACNRCSIVAVAPGGSTDGQNGWYVTPPMVTLGASDGGVAIEKLELVHEGFIRPQAPPLGVYHYRVIATDEAGNAAASATIRIRNFISPDPTAQSAARPAFTLFNPEGTPLRAISPPVLDDRRYRQLVDEGVAHHGHLDFIKQVGDPATGPIARYHMEMAWPAKIEIGALKAGSSEVWNQPLRWSSQAGSIRCRPQAPASPSAGHEVGHGFGHYQGSHLPGALRKLPGKRTPPTITLKRGK